MFAVHAVNTETLDLDAETTPTMLGFLLFTTALARGVLTGIVER